MKKALYIAECAALAAADQALKSYVEQNMEPVSYTHLTLPTT